VTAHISDAAWTALTDRADYLGVDWDTYIDERISAALHASLAASSDSYRVMAGLKMRDLDDGELVAPMNPEAEIMDRVSDTDRKYFAEHPDETVYHRPMIAGELGPVSSPEPPAGCGSKHMVEVELMGPGLRKRTHYVAVFPLTSQDWPVQGPVQDPPK
jgi:hypothetical protein